MHDEHLFMTIDGLKRYVVFAKRLYIYAQYSRPYLRTPKYNLE